MLICVDTDWPTVMFPAVPEGPSSPHAEGILYCIVLKGMPLDFERQCK